MCEKLAFSIDETAELLGLSRSGVKELIYHGELKVRRVGRRVLVPRWCLDEFLARTDEIPDGNGAEFNPMLGVSDGRDS